MKIPSKPDNEADRLKELERLNILDTPPEQEYNDIARLASIVCQTPIALVTLVDRKRQWFKANVGLGVTETPRDVSFCAYAILGEKLFTVRDAMADERFEGNPLVDDPGVRFYAGAPLSTDDGHALGTICVIDHEARNLSEEQEEALRALSRLTVKLMQARV